MHSAHIARTAALAAVALTAFSASALAGQCPKWTGTVVSGHVADLSLHVPDPATGQLMLSDKAVKSLPNDHYYYALSPSTVRYHGGTYKVGGSTLFGFGCFENGNPSLRLMQGTVTVPKAIEGGRVTALDTNEMLLDPFAHKSMGYRIVRTVRGGPYRFDQLAKVGTSPFHNGRSVMTQLGGSGAYVNVTPYVGPTPGTCHQARGAVGVSNGAKGTMTYRNLASFSPR